MRFRYSIMSFLKKLKQSLWLECKVFLKKKIGITRFELLMTNNIFAQNLSKKLLVKKIKKCLNYDDIY